MVGATAIAVPGIQEIAGTEEETVVEIGTVDQLKAFRDAVNSGNQYAGKTVKLTADLDLSGEANWKPIGNLVAYPGQSFNGIFDGDGHTISNLTVNDNTPNYAVAALFGSVVNGTIKNLTVKDVNITSTHYAAGIVAYTSNGPTIENCHVIGGTIKSTPEIVNGSYDNGDKVGGIMGYATASSTINNCTVEGVTLSAYRDMGGIVGYSDGTVTNNTAKNVTVTQDLTNGYKDTPPTTIGDIVGRGSATNNVEANGNKVIKSDPVAQIGETKYETIAEAVAAANASDVIEIIKAGEYTLPNLPKNVTIEGAVDGVVFNHTTTGSVASIPDGASFKNVTFNFGNNNYHGFQHAGTINMEGCTLNGKLFSYADMNFTNCEFKQTNSDYNMWVYGAGNVVYDQCTFSNSATGKMLHLYCESADQTHKVTVKDCKFVNGGSLNKAAINVKATSGSNALQYELHLEGNNTYEGSFPTAVGEQDNSDHTWILSPLAQVDDRSVSPDHIKVYENNVLIYPEAVAKIGDVTYPSLQSALDAAHEMTGDVTVELLKDIEGFSIVRQKDGLNLTIDGAEKTVNGQIIVDGDGRANGTETLTIKNIKFEDNASNFCAGTDAFVLVPSTKDANKPYSTGKYNYAHNITITDCSFNSTADAFKLVGFKSTSGATCYNLSMSNVTGNNLHSFAQLTATNGAAFDKCSATMTGSFIGVNGGSGAYIISNCEFESHPDKTDGYAYREKGNSTATATLTNNNFKAYDAIILGSAGTVNVESGTYVGQISKTDGSIVISDGHFSAKLGDAEYAAFIAEGKAGVNGIYLDTPDAPNGIGTAIVTLTDSEGKVSNYANLAPAVAAVSDESPATIKLLDNVTITDNVVIGGTYGDSPKKTVAINAQNITLDLNGHNISGDKTIYLAGGSLNITGEGTIETTGDGVAPVGVRYVKSADGLDYTSKRTLTIGENVTVKGADYGLNIFGTNEGTVANNIEVNVNGKVEGTLFVLGNLKNAENNIVVNVNGSVVSTTDAGIALNGNAKVNVAEGASVTGLSGIEVRAGELNVAGGTIKATAEEYSYNANGSGTTTKGAAIAVAQHNTVLPVTVTANGGTLEGTKTIAVVDVNNNQLENVTVKAKDELVADKTEIPAAFAWVSDGAGMSTLTPIDPVAKIGETVYYSLASAIAAVPNDGTETTITLLADVTENAVVKDGKNIVLDLGENTLTGYIDQYDGELNVKNGTLAGTVYVNGGPASAEAGYNKFTLAADATITSNWGFILYQGPNGNDAYGSVIDINGTVNGTAWVMGNIKEGNSVINVNSGAKIEGSVFGLNGLATLNVKDGATIIGSEAGIEVRAGNLNVEGGTITSTATEYSVNPNGSGTTTTGAAIAIAQHTTGLPINANITGGTLNGIKTISVADPEGKNLEDVVVTAKDELTEGNVVIPDGYIWVSNNNGTSTLALTTEMEMILIDGEPYPVKTTATYKKVTYRRTFGQNHKNKYQSWFIPFDYTITEDDVAKFDFYRISMIAGTERDGEVENNGAIYIYIVKLAAGYTLKANAAYMVKPHANYGQCDFVVEDNPVLYAPVDATSSRKHLETSEYSYDFYGNYATKYFENAYEVYWMGGGSLRPNAAKNSIGSYRWYIKRTGKESTDAKSSFVFVEDNNETTKITNVETIDSDEIDGIYSSNGVKLDTPQKGMNIVRYKNGKTKKIIIK